MKEKLLTSRECHYAIDYLGVLGYEDKEKMTVIDFMEKRVQHFVTDTPFQRMKNYARIKEFSEVIREDLNKVAKDLHHKYAFDCYQNSRTPIELKRMAVIGESYFKKDFDKIDDKDIFDKSR